ncbi:MAG: superoxide dismutase [Clostridia bacterium]|nr:superoxide dismutase [Clostridia bacterium]MDD4387094.1 superoxide dismutase [Clostridia bacterium]
MKDKYPFELIGLPYQYSALEPYIDTETVKLHHNKHLKKYVDNLNEILADYPIYHTWSLEKLILNNSALPPTIQIGVKNNAGGIYNHNLYFHIMKPAMQQNNLTGNLKEAIIKSFDSLENFYTSFENAALKVFGSGYAWLIVDKDKELKIVTSANQDVPLNVFHVLLIDVWEHAYYLKYKNRRDEYIINWYNIIDWDKSEKNYDIAINYLNTTKIN